MNTTTPITFIAVMRSTKGSDDKFVKIILHDTNGNS